MEYKYCLIISQYYHSRHSFIVKMPNDFINKAKSVIEKLENYKRENKMREYNYGDIGYHQDDDRIFGRYNVNDEGDIYFITSNSINDLLEVAENYRIESYKESRQYIKNKIKEDIHNYHNYFTIHKIIKEYFEIL